MGWRTRVTLSFFSIAMSAGIYVAILHQVTGIRASGTAHPQSESVIIRPYSSHSIQPLWRTIAAGRLTASSPVVQNKPKAGNVSSQVTRASMEKVAVQAAMEMMKRGDFNGAREVLRAAISRTSRGNTYLSFGRPDHISNETGPRPLEIWHYDASDGTGRYTPALFFSSAARPKYPITAYLDPGDPEDGASAFWAYTFSFYSEGGYGNKRKAVAQFQDFVTIFPNGPDDLVKAAQIDIGVINLELMESAPTVGYRVVAANEAASALKAFAARWPDDPKAYAASLALLNAQIFLSNPK